MTPKALFISHGGGPLPLLQDKNHAALIEHLIELAKAIPKPDAVIIVSAHWEETVPTITSSANPSLIYDYYGFPPESYSIQYPCPGSPTLAKKLQDMLKQQGLAAQLTEHRGLDHGVFVPLKLMYPEANIPCVQLSLLSALDPQSHIQLGQALRGLEQSNVLLIGSGFSFHNLRAFFDLTDTHAQQQNQAFEAWLTDTCANEKYSEEERTQRLIEWKKAPGAQFCHPREEHLMPLHVCYGFANAPCQTHTSIRILNKNSSTFIW
jgi:4,5-DOPA dioxygenase extradiol